MWANLDVFWHQSLLDRVRQSWLKRNLQSFSFIVLSHQLHASIFFFFNFFHFQGNQHFKCLLRQTAACVYLYGGFTANIYISWHLPVHVFIYITIWTHLSYRCMHVTKINFRSSIRSKFSKFLFKSLCRTHINKFKLFIEFEFIS